MRTRRRWQAGHGHADGSRDSGAHADGTDDDTHASTGAEQYRYGSQHTHYNDR
jgi:hypothetical protein